MKSFLVSTLTGGTSQLATITTLYLTKNKIMALLVLQVFGTLLAYCAQAYVFGIKGGLFGPVFLRWMLTATMTLFLSYKMVIYIGNLEKVKEFSGKFKGRKKIIFDYLSIMVAVLVTFFMWEFPMRKLFIFDDSINTNMYALLIMSVVVGFVVYDQKMLNDILGDVLDEISD